MYPDFDREDIKDISTESSDDLNEEPALTLEDNVPDGEATPVDSAIEDESSEELETAEAALDETPNSVLNDEEGNALPEESAAEEGAPKSQNSAETASSAAKNSGNYLLFGGMDIPAGINYDATRKFLVEQLKFDGGEIRQARQKKDGSGIVVPEEKTKEFCSYCGVPISGVDYHRLPDGRKRCTTCSRSLVKSLDELNTIFNDVVINMELFFGAVIDVPMSVEMLEERKLKKKIGKGLQKPPKNALILGVAVERKGKYTVYIENGIPKASLVATLVHELTHIWQYTHWKSKNIKKTYGSKMRLIVYEGMAMWSEIQYLYHIGENTMAKRDEISTLARKDEYGIGFAYYLDQYPINTEIKAFIDTPFSAGETPLDVDD